VRTVEDLLAASRSAGADQLGGLVRAAAGLAGATDARVYLIDYDRLWLVALAETGPQREELPVLATPAGRCYVTGQPQQAARDCWVPLADGPRRLGVLRLSGPGIDPVAGAHLADLTALLLTSRQSYSDLVEQTKRRQRMGLAAEVLWSLLPPVTVQTDTLTVAGVLEPCYRVGGDAFDYAINGPVAHWAIFDAMGHGLPASLQATVAVNGYRNARRAGLGLPDIYRTVDAALREAAPGSFVTAVLAELDTTGGQLRYLAAGHPAPLLLRDGAPVRTLASPTAMPLGLADQAPRTLREPRVLSEPLRPGDRILSYTDGVVEARNADGVFFGRDQLSAFVGRGLAEATSTAELLRRLIHRVMEHQHTPLRDDASALLVHWHP
jgi:sigma-B regulation protein RsbU (phosphoserine phosphatase)